MKLSLNGIKDAAAWKAAGISLPSYDVEKIAADTRKAPVWVHFGAGNIFRIFVSTYEACLPLPSALFSLYVKMSRSEGFVKIR